MLAVVLLVVVATVQVECAPNQLWPAFSKVSVQPTKKPIFATAVDKETQRKNIDPSATQHAYEQFINTWLRQASLTLNRPDLLKLIQTPSTTTQAPSQLVMEESVVQPVLEEELISSVVPEVADAPVEEIVPLADEVLMAEPEIIEEVVLEEPVDTITPEVVFTDADPTETLLEIAEVASPVKEDILVPVAVEESPLIIENIESSPLAENVEIVPVVELVDEPIPSLVEQDTATVLTASPATPSVEPEITPEIVVEASPEPLAEAQPLEILQPIAESADAPEPLAKKIEPEVERGTGRSFSSVQRERVFPPQEVVVVPIEKVHQSQQSPVNSPARAIPFRPIHRFQAPEAVTTDGLTYTLQFFPRRGLSHYFVSTPIGG